MAAADAAATATAARAADQQGDDEQSGSLAQLFVAADSAIERRRTDNIFKQLDERSLTEDEEKIIQQRVELQRKLLEEYERREQKRKVVELQDMWPDLSEAAASRALELCNGKEEEAVLRLTEDSAFKRRVMQETGTYTPTMIVVAPKQRRNKAVSSGSSRSTTTRIISPSQMGGRVFVGRFRSKLGPYQVMDAALQAALPAAGTSGTSPAAAAAAPPAAAQQPKKRGRKRKSELEAATSAGAAAAAGAGAGGSAALPPTGAAAAAAATAATASPDVETALAAAAALTSSAAAAGAGSSGGAAVAAVAGGEAAGADVPSHKRQRSSSPSSDEPEGAADTDDADTETEPEAAGAAGDAAATDSGCDTDTGAQHGRQPDQQQGRHAVQADMVVSMMARQVARLEPLLAAGRLLEFEARRPGSSPAVLEALAAEYDAKVSVPIATAWEVLLEEQKLNATLGLQAAAAASTAAAAAAATATATATAAAAAAAATSSRAAQSAAGVVKQAPAAAAASVSSPRRRSSRRQQQQQQQQQQPPDAVQVQQLPDYQQQQHEELDDEDDIAAMLRPTPPQQEQEQQQQQEQQQEQEQKQLARGILQDVAAQVAAPACSDASTVSEQAAEMLNAGPTEARAAAAEGGGGGGGEPAGTPSSAAAASGAGDSSGRGRGRRAAAAAAAAVSAAAAAEAGSSRGKGKGKGASSSKGGGGAGGSRASRAISETGHTCRGRVRQKSHKTTELVDVGELMVHKDWYNAGYIFPAGFKTRLLFRSSVDTDALCLHECEIIGEGGQFWPAPTFMVTARDREDEPIVAKSCTGCWSQILKRINATISQRIAAGENLPPPPRTAIAGPEYFGLNDLSTQAAIEALDPDGLCTTYWEGKRQREAASAGLPIPVQPLARGNSSSVAGGSGGANGNAGGNGRGSTGRKRGRPRASDAADADDEGEDGGYKGNHWSAISRRERYLKRCTDAGDELPVDADQNLLPGLLDPVTLEPVVNPAISPAGHVMGLATWKAVLSETGRCPFTKAPLRPDMLTVLTVNNIEKHRARIVAMS